MKKVLVSDYDDTFYISDEDIANNIKLLEEHSDKIFFIIATGRSYFDYQKKKDLYNIKSDYVILNHGATIIKGDNIIYNLSMDNKIKNNIIHELEMEKVVNFFGCYKKESRLPLESANLTKIYVKYDDENKAIEINEKINKKYGDFVTSFLVSRNTAIEIVNSMVNKKDAILNILDKEGINSDLVYVVGDGDTDYEMIKYFNGFIMKNSTPKLKDLNVEMVNSVSEIIKKLSNNQ